jgi:H+/gluconate symporter-like permease
VLVFGIAAGVFVFVGFLVFASLRRQLAQPSKMFRASLAELETDMAQLRRREEAQ